MGKLVMVLTTLMAAACGGGDDCERFFAKSKPFFEKLAKEHGKTLTDADKTKFVEKCRATKKEGDPRNDAMMKCVLDAANDAAVAACIEQPFGDFTKKAKVTEASLQLNKLGKFAKLAVMEKGQFPIGKSATPSDSCCEGPNHKCAAIPGAEWAADPVWSKLDFQIDEPTLFRYSYESTDGKTFVARAVGDLDCDTNMITYEMRGSIVEGNAAVELVAPPPNSD